MNLYFDTGYVAKCYINEPESEAVRKLVQASSGMYTSLWSVAEMACVFQRQIREFKMPKSEAARARDFFLADLQDGVWSVLPISERFLFRVELLISTLPPSLYLRAGDAIHLVAAQEAGFTEIWSNDRRVLQAAPAFGLTGKSF